MSELGGEFRQVEQVATYVTFGGGCVTLPELCQNFFGGVRHFAGTFGGGAEPCRNLSDGTCGTLPELCRKDKRSLQRNYCGTCRNLAGTMADPSSGFMSLGDRRRHDKPWRNLPELAGTCRNFAGTLPELCRNSAGTLAAAHIPNLLNSIKDLGRVVDCVVVGESVLHIAACSPQRGPGT